MMKHSISKHISMRPCGLYPNYSFISMASGSFTGLIRNFLLRNFPELATAPNFPISSDYTVDHRFS